jgi:hypothetical protein
MGVNYSLGRCIFWACPKTELNVTRSAPSSAARAGTTIRSIEVGRLALSPNLATLIAAHTGADPAWLLANDLSAPMPPLERVSSTLDPETAHPELMDPDLSKLINGMLDANDCFQCANFDLLHGFYRAAISTLRTALELLMIGTFGNVRPTNKLYESWKKGMQERLGFSECRRQLGEIYKGTKIEWLFTKNAFPALIYADLCRFTHARPDAFDGALWKRNGPVYDGEAILKAFKLGLDVYSLCKEDL